VQPSPLIQLESITAERQDQANTKAHERQNPYGVILLHPPSVLRLDIKVANALSLGFHFYRQLALRYLQKEIQRRRLLNLYLINITRSAATTLATTMVGKTETNTSKKRYLDYATLAQTKCHH
jgi:hypothetical protein